MTYRDDCFKTMGVLRPLLLALKNLEASPFVAADNEIKSSVATSYNILNETYTKVSEKAYRAAPGTKLTKVVVMPPEGSKEEFAISAMLDAFGIKTTEAVVPELVKEKPTVSVKPEAQKPPLGVRTEPPKPQPVKKDEPKADDAAKAFVDTVFGTPPSPAQPIEPHSGFPPMPALTESQKTNSYYKWSETEHKWVLYSKVTNQPKRPYNRSGLFTDEAKAARSKSWNELSDEEKRQRRSEWLSRNRKTVKTRRS